MLREYQEEIKALKAQLESASRGVMIDSETGKEIRVHDATKEIVETIVEREVIKEVHTGISDEELHRIRSHADQEKQSLMKQAQEDMKSLIDQQSRTAQERAELQAAIDREAADRAKLEDQKSSLINKLKMMEEKLITGGEMMNKATQQEMQLRKAENELRQRQQQEGQLARELAEKEEANLQLEEHFTSLQEEVEVKTKKLKKLFAKYQGAVRETKDLQEEFQTERTDLLDTIRDLSQNLKLKELIISNFIPDDSRDNIEKRASWSAEDDTWIIQRVELSGNQIRNRKQTSSLDKGRMKGDKGTRGNIEFFDSPDKEDVTNSHLQSSLDRLLAMGMDSDDYVVFPNETSTPYPFLQYEPGASGEEKRRDNEGGGRSSRPKTGKKSSGGGGGEKSSRPKSAARRRDGDEGKSSRK